VGETRVDGENRRYIEYPELKLNMGYTERQWTFLLGPSFSPHTCTQFNKIKSIIVCLGGKLERLPEIKESRGRREGEI
jgi:hypothetical protein